MKRRAFVLALLLVCISRAAAQAAPTLATSPLVARINGVLAQPALAHSTIGIEFLDLATNRPIYALNAHRLFSPASTTKVLTVGSVLQTLGPDYRYHTRVYRNGNIDATGIPTFPDVNAPTARLPSMTKIIRTAAIRSP
jgi:D-alanyl-D-alanine carboxypeptidase